MTNRNGSRGPGTPSGTVACRQCGATTSTTDTTCARCGAAQLATADAALAKSGSAHAARRRLGGSSWSPEVAAARAQPATPSSPATNGKRTGRRRLGATTWKAIANGSAPSAPAANGHHPHPAPDTAAPAATVERPTAILGPTQPAAQRVQASAPAPVNAPASKRRPKKRGRSSSAAGRTATPAAGIVPAVSAVTTATPETRSRTRRRHRRSWYRRPFLVIPLAVVGVILAGLGLVAFRAESAINAIHEVSTPPPVVADATLDDDPIWDTVQIDTSPAQQAVRAVAASEGADETDAGDGGLGRIKDAASNVGDLASGAAVAAGVTDADDHARTILVMGVDAQPGAAIDVAVRPDAMMVLRLDEAARTCRLLAIPRDTRTRLPGYGETKINHALMVGGIPYQQLVVEQFLDLEIDSYVLVDFVGFEKLVDAVGGITIDVPEELNDRGVHFDAGPQTFDGAQALAYVRYRADDQGDVGRIYRQWAVLEALLESGSTRDLVGDVNSIMPALADHLRSDLDTADFAAIAETYGGRCTVETIDATLLKGLRVRLDDPLLDQAVYYNVVTEEQVQAAVDTLLGHPPATAENSATSARGRGMPTSGSLA